MKLFALIKDMIKYISEAVGGIFAPSHDHYPAIGIQPFEGTFYHSRGWVD